MGVTTRMTEITLPRLGETMEEARVTDWLVAPGVDFARGDILMEVETDKTVVEVPALMAGRMVEHLAAVGDQVGIGQPIAQVEVEGAGAVKSEPVHEAPTPEAGVSTPSPSAPAPNTGAAGVAASPAARRSAKLAGIVLAGLTGTGRRGRITAADIDAASRAAGAGRAGSRDRVTLPRGNVVFDRIAPSEPATGAPVVLLHGLFADAASWRELPRRIAARGHAVIVPDLPGHGDSAMDLPDLDAFIAMLRDFLDSVLPDGPVVLVGHSLGALAAAHMAARLGDRLKRLILFAPVGLGARMPIEFLDTMAEARSIEALARGLGWLGAGADRLSGTALAQELARAEPERPVRRMLVAAIAAGGVQQVALAPYLAPVADRTVAIFGLADRIVDWRDATALPPGVAVHFVPDAGHLPQLATGALLMRLLA